MTTLPPEDDRSGAGGQPDQPQQPEPPQVPEPPLDPPQAPEQPQEPLGQPQAPQAPQQPSGAPQQGYQAPPQQPGYQQAPPPGAYQQPGGYQQQPGGGYQPPAGGYPQAPVSDPVSNITLNYWLSVFFAWIPALIFYMIEKDKGDQRAYVYHRDNLNFSLVRTIVYAAIIVVGWIPYIGWILAGLLWLGQIVLFVFHIIAAVKAPDGFRRGEQPNFIFNLPLVR